MKIAGLAFMLFLFGCREVYEPPAIKNTPDFLVVDGFITGDPDSTYITLTHTRSLKDTAPSRPELNATLTIYDEIDNPVFLTEFGNGRYGTLLKLNPTAKYRLFISTTEGRQYVSDFIPVKQTAPIDSLSWSQDSVSVKFYVSTHDPQNNSVYYRWQFEETWRYTTYLNSNFDYVNGIVVMRKPEDQIHHCWKTYKAGNILVGTSAKLREDVISLFQFNSVSKTTEKINDQYSVLVKQCALTKDQFEYWTELRKNSEQTGSIFDAQPSALTSNIHCLTNPNEPVMGYLSVATVQQKRLFVDIYQMTNYNYTPYFIPCFKLADVTVSIGRGEKEKRYEYLEMPNHLFTLWYAVPDTYFLAQNFCIDCREHGGTNQKPGFWP